MCDQLVANFEPWYVTLKRFITLVTCLCFWLFFCVCMCLFLCSASSFFHNKTFSFVCLFDSLSYGLFLAFLVSLFFFCKLMLLY